MHFILLLVFIFRGVSVGKMQIGIFNFMVTAKRHFLFRRCGVVAFFFFLYFCK
jgi:hypothetical protein